jgi:hypothetical protein
MLLFAWMAKALFSAASAPTSRQMRQRARLSIEHLARVVRLILFLRAVQLFERKHRVQRQIPARAHAPPGFARRSTSRHFVRAIIGSSMRKQLTARGPMARIARLIGALRDLDALAVRLFKRLYRKLARGRPIRPVRPPHDAAAPHLVLAAAAINSSLAVRRSTCASLPWVCDGEAIASAGPNP